MQHHVLLVVDDEASDVARCNRSRRRRDRAPDRDDCEYGPSRNVVGRLGVALHRRLGDLVRKLLTGRADRGDVETHELRPGRWLRHIRFSRDRGPVFQAT